MKGRTILSIVGGLVFSLCAASLASAATVNCTIPDGNGVATLTPGIVDGDLNMSESGAFNFKAANMSCPAPNTVQSVCSIGTLANASCIQNNHSGSYVVCAGADSCEFTGPLPIGTGVRCKLGKVQLTSGTTTFQGSCLLSNCKGAQGPGGKPLTYDLTFSLQTDIDALTHCPAPPNAGLDCTAPSCSLTDATFGGPISFTEP